MSAANTQTDAKLSLTLGTTEIACQVIDGSLSWPTTGTATTVPTACGGDPVAEPGDPQPGAITGEVYKDTGTDGVTRLLIQALEAGTDMVYTWVEGEDTDPGRLSVTGNCRVDAHEQTFAPDKFGRHPLSLSVSTATSTFGPVVP